MPKQEIYLILPDSKHNSEGRLNELTQHIVGAWHTLVAYHYWDANSADLYQRLQDNNQLQAFQAINQWLTPLAHDLPYTDHSLTTTIEWTIELLDATQIYLMHQHVDGLQSFYTGTYNHLHTSIQNNLRYLLIDHCHELNTHIQSYQNELAHIHSTRCNNQPILYTPIRNTKISITNKVKTDIAHCIDDIQRMSAYDTPEYYVQQFIEGMGTFIQRIMGYRNMPDLFTCYQSQRLELAPPPFQIDSLIKWLNEHQLSTLAQSIEKKVARLFTALHLYLKTHQLSSLLKPTLSNPIQLKIAIDQYIQYIKTTAGIQTISVYTRTDDAAKTMDIQDVDAAQLCTVDIATIKVTPAGCLDALQQSIRPETRQWKAAISGYGALQVHNNTLTHQLNTVSHELGTLFQDPTSIWQYPNLQTIIQAVLTQRLDWQNNQYKQTPINQTAYSSSSSQNNTFHRPIKPSLSRDSLNSSSFFHSPLSVESMINRTASPHPMP